MRVKWEVFDLKEFFLEVFDLMKFNAKVKGVQLELITDYEQFVEADRNIISTVLRNIVSNAIKFTDKQQGYVKVSIDLDSESVVLGILDNGVVLGEVDIKKLFSKEA